MWVFNMLSSSILNSFSLHFFGNLDNLFHFDECSHATFVLIFPPSCWSLEFKQWRQISIISSIWWYHYIQTKTDGNARRERNKFCIYRIVNKNYWECWTREGKVKNSKLMLSQRASGPSLREGPANTKWKLVRRPRREMGSKLKCQMAWKVCSNFHSSLNSLKSDIMQESCNQDAWT